MLAADTITLYSFNIFFVFLLFGLPQGREWWLASFWFSTLLEMKGMTERFPLLATLEQRHVKAWQQSICVKNGRCIALPKQTGFANTISASP